MRVSAARCAATRIRGRALHALAACSAALVLGAPIAARADAPTTNLHELEWLVHVDMIDAGAGRDLDYYAALLEAALEDGTALVEGYQGPADSACCDVINALSIGTFGTPGDGLDVPDSAADQAALDAIVGASGSTGFLVDSLGWCGGPTTTAIGCGTLAPCTGNPNDDPGLKLIVTMEAHEVYDVLGETIAHERGHNSCLGHVTPGEQCWLMTSTAGGGCLSASECTAFDNGRTDSGGSCACHDGSGGIESDGTSCSEGSVTGQCSGGLCGELDSDAAVALLAAGGPEAAEGATPDDALRLSGLSGGWVNLGAIGGDTAPTGLEYSTLRGVLYAVNPLAGDDELITIDPDTGARASTIGTLSGKQQVIALAFDPGDSDAESDDRLLALDRVGSFEDLFEIDPDDASVNDLGGLNLGVTGGFQGLAYDSLNDKLYASGFAGTGLYEIDLACPSFCFMSSVPSVSVVRRISSLAFSEQTGRLYLVGSQSGPRSLFDSIDATTLEALPSIGIDDYTAGGLAAIPVPEPNARLVLAAGALALAALARRRALIRTQA